MSNIDIVGVPEEESRAGTTYKGGIGREFSENDGRYSKHRFKKYSTRIYK